MSEKLKPCPFCGGTDIALMDLAGWEAWCRNCGSAAGCTHRPTGIANTRDQMIAAWNRRELEGASQPGGRCVKCGGAKVNPSPLMTGACECQAECPRCNGSGWVTRDPDIGTDQECSVCDGTGHIEEESQSGDVTPDWIWNWLVDYCRARRLSPSAIDSMFKIVGDARKALAAPSAGNGGAEGVNNG